MNAFSSPPLLVFRILADRQGVPAGLLANVGTDAPGAILSVLTGTRAATLCREFPCLYRTGARTDADLVKVLNRAGWLALSPGSLFHVENKLVKEFIPPGAAWIEGDWCMAPPPKAIGAQAASRALALQLVQLVAADADTHEIEALLRRDPTLSYQLLRLVNSLGMGVVRRVTSFSQALMILGRQQLRRWLNLMLFAARQGDPRSSMLLARVAVRARALELLAKARGFDKTTQEQAFMAGMFSLLGILFGMALPDVLAPLSISDAVQRALLEREGELGALLRLVETAEQGDLDRVAAQLDALQLLNADFNDTMIEANRWMLGAVRDSKGKAYA